MSRARSRQKSGLAILIAVAALPACNEIVGIGEPAEIPISDGSAVDASPRGGSGGGSASDQRAPSSEASVSDTLPPPVLDAPASPDAPSSGGRGGTGGGSLADAPGEAAMDVRDGGVLIAPGTARGTCLFSNVQGANADISAFTSTTGIAVRKMVAGDEVVEISVSNINAGVERSLKVRMKGPLAPEKVIVLDHATLIEYFDVRTGRGWSSTSVSPPSGTIRVNEVVGTSFTFNITSAKLGPVLTATGSFTLNGLGTANAP